MPDGLAHLPDAGQMIAGVLARALAPRRRLSVSEWAEAERVLSATVDPESGPWRNARNPLQREIMDALSAHSPVQDVVCMLPIQWGKTAIALNWLGYTMDHDPSPIMVCLPGEVSMNKWIQQKLTPLLEATPACTRALASTASRDAANQRAFKEFAGGQLYLEHAGSAQRLKSISTPKLIVDELDEFAANTAAGDDPVDMLDGRTSAFPTRAKRLFISTPGIKGLSRIDDLYRKGDQRRYHVPCPHCGHFQPLEWAGLTWSADGSSCRYACAECGAEIDEHHKPAMLAAGRWVPGNPGAPATLRSYHVNALYYPLGLGPRWHALAEKWRAAQGDVAKLKTFINDRLAEPWEDPAMRQVRHDTIADRAEPYRLRTAPLGVLAITAGVDTQDDRLEVQIVGWGRGLTAWTLDYAVLPGDPVDEAVWLALIDLLDRPIEHVGGQPMRVEATAIDAGGHRTQAVYHFVRSRRVRRCMPIFGATQANAPVISRGKLVDVNWRGQLDRRGVTIHHVGTVAIKHLLYSRLGADAERPPEARQVRFSDELPGEFYRGLTAEVFNPAKGTFQRRRGAGRNEPLDTWNYAYAAAHHPELRLHRLTERDWQQRESRLLVPAGAGQGAPAPPAPDVPRETKPAAPATTPAAPRARWIDVDDRGWGR